MTRLGFPDLDEPIPTVAIIVPPRVAVGADQAMDVACRVAGYVYKQVTLRLLACVTLDIAYYVPNSVH